jgi:hypothetical protein
MKKLVLLLSFVFVLGLVSVSAQDKKKEVKNTPVKTEKAAVKPAEKAKPVEKAKAGEKVKKTKHVAPKTEKK